MSQSIHVTISEEDLISLLKKRDEKGVSYLYDKYANALFPIIFRIVLKEDLANDVLQESFVKIWQNFNSFDSSKGSLYTWMLNICRNTSIDKVRSKGFKNELKNRNLDSFVSIIDNSEPVMQKTNHIGIKDLTNKLNKEQKIIVDLIYFSGFTHTEAAEELNLPIGTVKSRLRAAIIELRKYF